MELLRSGDFHYTLHTESRDGVLRAYILKFRQPLGDARLPRTAERYDFVESFRDQQQAFSSALSVAHRMVAGDMSAAQPQLQKKLGDYKLVATAAFNIVAGKWEPVLRVISRRPANKGAEQTFNEPPSPLLTNLCPSAQRATDYALEYGERLVSGAVPGLRV